MWHLLSFLSLIAISTALNDKYRTIEVEDKDYWLSMSSSKLDAVLKRQQKNSVAKNVIVFIGDGMGMTTITAGRIFEGQQKKKNGEGNILSFEKFPATGLSKTYNFNTQVPDSASTATAIFTGVKTKHYVLGLDSIAEYNSCIPETNKKATVTSIMSWAQKSGRDTGIVTTTRITHATPAATYSHINNRNWECDSLIPKEDVGCVKDIARQLVEDEPGKYFKVILGGGRSQLGDVTDSGDYCTRKDGRNLVTEWKNSKSNSKYVKTADELSKIDIKSTDYLLGLFSSGHMKYVADNDPARPSLKLMTEKAIKILQKNVNGFVLMVEGGRIDHGHHNNTPGLALSELVDLNEAVEAAVEITDPEETLIIVTADHSHAMTLNGYPDRGNDILGLATNGSDSFYETLTYANGPGYAYHHLRTKQNNCVGNCSENARESLDSWRNLRNDTSRRNNLYYQHLASMYLEEETHGGEDVPIYATGSIAECFVSRPGPSKPRQFKIQTLKVAWNQKNPSVWEAILISSCSEPWPRSYLLVGVHEQNYIASVISYAACMGPEAHRCKDKKSDRGSAPSLISFHNILTSSLVTLTALILNN